jgi:hypothetical protein
MLAHSNITISELRLPFVPLTQLTSGIFTRSCASNSCPEPNFAYDLHLYYSRTLLLPIPCPHPMSTSDQTTDPSTSNFAAIFDVASQEYKTLTKQDLGTHPFAAALEGYDSPDAILGVFRKQAQAFDRFFKGDDKLMAWLTPIVNILFTFSAILGEGIGLVSHHPFYITQSYNHLFSSLSRQQRLYLLASVSFLE